MQLQLRKSNILYLVNSVTRLGALLDFGQLFKAFGTQVDDSQTALTKKL